MKSHKSLNVARKRRKLTHDTPKSQLTSGKRSKDELEDNTSDASVSAEYALHRTRQTIATVVVVLFILSLLFSSVLGLMTGNFFLLSLCLYPLFFAVRRVIEYFFPRRR